LLTTSVHVYRQSVTADGKVEDPDWDELDEIAVRDAGVQER
jgi:hypothetical protein